MTNEMKLLHALCDALGFEVKTNLDYQRRKETKENAMSYNMGRLDSVRVLVSEGPAGRLVIDGRGQYTSELKSPVVSYNLNKKKQ